MDNSEQKLIRLLLDKDFYHNNKHRVVPEMFPGSLSSIYRTIQEGHNRYDRSLNLDELRALHRSLHPTQTRAERNNVYELLFDIEQDDKPLGPDIAADVLSDLWRKETFRRIAEAGVEGMEGKIESLSEVERIIEATGDDFLPIEEVQELGYYDLDELFDKLNDRSSWRFNIPRLAKRVPGGAAGDFMIAFARPEAGKTAFHVSLSCAPGGFCDQGARVKTILNEEPGERTLARAASALTGMTREQINENRDAVRERWRELRKNYDTIYNVDLTMEQINAYCKKAKPDILIVDQLDKVHVSGSFARNDQKLREIYRQAREIAARHETFFIGISQASADAEGKTKLTYSMMEESKTGKAAEADLIVGIGRRSSEESDSVVAEEDKLRYLTVSKNKITGWHGTEICVLDGAISTYHD